MSVGIGVWEWYKDWWRPYTASLSQHLEKAFSKKHNAVYLRDVDPALADYVVNIADHMGFKQRSLTNPGMIDVHSYFKSYSMQEQMMIVKLNNKMGVGGGIEGAREEEMNMGLRIAVFSSVDAIF